MVSILESFTSSTPTELRTFASNNRSQLMAWNSTEAVLSFLPIMMGKFGRSTVLQMRKDRFAESVQVLLIPRLHLVLQAMPILQPRAVLLHS